MQDLVHSGYDVLGLDWTMNVAKAKQELAGKAITFQGNLDPCALYSSKVQ